MKWTHCIWESHWSHHKAHKSGWRISHSIPAKMMNSKLIDISINILKYIQDQRKQLHLLSLSISCQICGISFSNLIQTRRIEWRQLRFDCRVQAIDTIDTDFKFHCTIYTILSHFLLILQEENQIHRKKWRHRRVKFS